MYCCTVFRFLPINHSLTPCARILFAESVQKISNNSSWTNAAWCGSTLSLINRLCKNQICIVSTAWYDLKSLSIRPGPYQRLVILRGRERERDETRREQGTEVSFNPMGSFLLDQINRRFVFIDREIERERERERNKCSSQKRKHAHERTSDTYRSFACVTAACKNDSATNIRFVCCETEYLSQSCWKIFLSDRSINVGSGSDCVCVCDCEDVVVEKQFGWFLTCNNGWGRNIT